MSEPLTFQIEVPRTHPGLQRLLDAAKALPVVEVAGELGVSFTKKQILVPGVYEEFFHALGEVIGHDHADDMLSALSSRNRLQDAPQEALMNLAKNLQTLPLLGALKLFGG